jgi:hypothetical protein
MLGLLGLGIIFSMSLFYLLLELEGLLNGK